MLVSSIPSNLKLDVSGDQTAMMMVDSDLYNIAERIKEIDPNLYIVYHEKHEKPFTVMENCTDGVTRFVARYEELDSRVLDHLRYIASVPFDERLKKAEAEVDAAAAAYESIDEETLDWLAFEMRKDLRKYGITHG